MTVDLYIQAGPQTVYAPVLTGGVTWETQRKGQAGKLTFSVLSDDILQVSEGNAVRLDVDGVPLFFGYLFERGWGKDGVVKAVAYDQLRYLKNKETYNYENLTASEVIRKIAGDFNLRCGQIEDTGFKIKQRACSNKTLFDIILEALDLTMLNQKKIYALYDHAGWLTLTDVEKMKLNLLIDEETAEDYDYKASIDANTYNQIKILYENKSTNKKEFYMTKSSENINKWGILQYTETIQDPEYGPKKAESYLTLYNQPTRSLSIKNAIGDIHVRAGCILPISLDIHEQKLTKNLLVEHAKHTFQGGMHTMDLTLKGAGIFG